MEQARSRREGLCSGRLDKSFRRREIGSAIGICGLLFLGATLYAFGQGVSTRNASPTARGPASGKPFLAKFTDVAAQAGLSMRFVVGNETKKRYIVEANGTGVALIDYDNDGRLDLFLVNGSQLEGFGATKAPTNHLYRNAGAGKFIDVTEKAGLGRSGWGSGVCAGDVDNDGNVDLYVSYWGRNAMYRNRGDGTFEDVTIRSGTGGPEKEWSSGCTFLDYDRDGDLDLMVTSYQAFDLATAPEPGKGANCEWKGMPVFCGPRGLPYGAVSLYRNRGDFTFEDVSASSGVGAVKGFYAFTPVAVDLNGDDWTDVYIACDSTPSILFRNNKDGTFSDIGAEAGVAFSEHGFEQGGMGVGVGDFDNDGLLDLVKTNFAGDYPNLFRNLGKSIFEDVVIRSGLGVNPQYVGWGVAFADLDNDGWSDILQVNGHVYPELDAGQRKTQESYRNPRLVYRNLGDGRFEDVSALAGPAIADRRSSRGAAFGDLDNDGDIDVLVMNMGEPPSLLRNDLPSTSHWIGLGLQGVKSNRSAIGATVRLEAGGQSQTKPVLSQSSYVSQNDLRLHFGLGRATKVDKITVRWPSGRTEEFPSTPADGFVVLVEGSGAVKRLAGGTPGK
jgi:enediyne biosynthesis protein E4